MIGPKKLSTIYQEIRAAFAKEKENPIVKLDREIRKLKRASKSDQKGLKSLVLVRNALARALDEKPPKRARTSRAKRASKAG